MVALPRIIAKRWPGAGVDVLVNNAGLGRNNAALWDGATASWVEMVSTNVLGVCMCTREALQARTRPHHTASCTEIRDGCTCAVISVLGMCACGTRHGSCIVGAPTVSAWCA